MRFTLLAPVLALAMAATVFGAPPPSKAKTVVRPVKLVHAGEPVPIALALRSPAPPPSKAKTVRPVKLVHAGEPVPISLSLRDLEERKAPVLNVTTVAKGICFLEDGLKFNSTEEFFASPLGQGIISAGTKLNITDLSTSVNCDEVVSPELPSPILVTLGLYYVEKGFAFKNIAALLKSLNKKATKNIETVVKVKDVEKLANFF